MTLPELTTEQMREVDRIMTEDFGVDVLQMMESAGLHLAELAIDRFAPTSVTILAGRGGNGGGGLAGARHLAGRGVEVTVVLARRRADLIPAAAKQRTILGLMGVPFATEPLTADLVIDSLIGYSLTGEPRGRAAELIRWINAQDAPVLALDMPSGFDAGTGRAGDPTVRATATMTLGAPKLGLADAEETGELWLADIGIPASIYSRLGFAAEALFGGRSLLRID